MTTSYANAFDHAVAGTYEAREADWRMGAVVYQVLVDRFVPPADLDAKRHLYPAPKRLRAWDERPRQGEYLAAHKLWSHEIEFWGGDLQSLATRLDHLQSLHADVLYLNPICDAYTNHKYDALDYRGVSPEYGTRDDVKALAARLHADGMKLVLDGVFNHMGRNSTRFRAAEASAGAPERDWFVFDPTLPGGARAWWRAENLPELNLENPAVRADLWGAPDSVVRGWLRDGADGWRLDVAFDIGFAFLDELTRAAHAEKPGSLVVGEIPNWPAQWMPAVDGTMHFGLRRLLIEFAAGRLDGATFGRMLERLLADCGIEHLLRCWIYLDNHDTVRLTHALPDRAARHLAQVLQFTLPGSPNLYYGSEVDLDGGDDPEMRAPMPWDRVAAGHPTLDLVRRLGALRRSHRALRVGDWRPLIGQRLFGFERHTDRAADSVLVLVNPGEQPVEDLLLVPDSKLMDATPLVDLLGTLPGPAPQLRAGLLQLALPAKGVAVLGIDTAPQGGYTNYKRVQ